MPLLCIFDANENTLAHINTHTHPSQMFTRHSYAPYKQANFGGDLGKTALIYAADNGQEGCLKL